jgi:hypothetical protein
MKAKAFKLPAGGWEVQGGAVVKGLVADLKLKDFQAAGHVGQFGYESGEFKHLHEIGQPENQGGYGWGQWTGSRRIDFFNWCDAQGLDWRSDEANYGYAVYELIHGYKSYLGELKKTKTVEEATHLAHRKYETPSDVLDGSEISYPARLRYARLALAGAGGQPAPEPTPGPTPTPGPIDRSDLEQALLAQAAITRIIQHALGLKVDGDYGSATREAVRAYLKER